VVTKEIFPLLDLQMDDFISNLRGRLSLQFLVFFLFGLCSVASIS
jgi:hypothetical protein